MILNIVDVDTSYSERCGVKVRDAKNTMGRFEERLLLKHGVPQSLSADAEFRRPFFKTFT